MNRLLILALVALNAIPSVSQQIPMDYSYCGYHRSETPIPSARVAAYVTPSGDSDAATLQAAIDYVSRQKPDRHTGLRGAVLLGEGTFLLDQPLYVRTSGVVIRGSGRDKTIIRKTGYDRGAAVYIEGIHDIVVRDTLPLSDVAPGSMTCSTLQPSNFAKGMRLIIWRPSTEAWIASLGCASFGGGKRMGYWAWHPGDIDLHWHRIITGVNGTRLTLDAPLTCSVEARWGGAKAIVYEQPGLVAECGVEHLTLESDYDRSRPLDEDHCWDGVYVADAENCWVRMVNFRHFAGSAVVVQKSARQVTVEDCQSLQPVSEIGGFRRRTFLTMGEMTLFQRCYSEHGINDFAVEHTAPGPNAFVQCESFQSLGPSGAISSWAPGILFDIVNIDGHDITFKNWELQKFGAGWSTANSTLWQSTAAGLFCYSPDTLNRNISHGCWGQIQGNGDYSQMNEHVQPYSLFADQLAKRRMAQGEQQQEAAAAVQQLCRTLVRDLNGSSSPTVDEATAMAREALLPRTTLQMWIDSAVFTADITPGRLKPFSRNDVPPYLSDTPSRDFRAHHYAVTNGWLTRDKAVLVGKKHHTPWWSGRILESFLPKASAALTRFVPGQEGKGLTDRVDSVVAEMQRHHVVLYSQNYGLWTDRRRDDHERIRRRDGDVWAPFFEQPFARTGQYPQNICPNSQTPKLPDSHLAWDGLSKYDLTTLNKWYFYRLQQFARKTQPMGMLLKNQHYFQHNILEAGAHWVDCPWRTANNVNGTPFPEPVNFTGDKRIFTATQFYDTGNPTLRQLHRQYIRQSLDAFKDNSNVIHSIGEEFTGPLHFVQFWLDVIHEWEQENGPVLVALAVNKDVQDSVLADPVRSKVVDIIDIEQWFYHNKGEYAPPGGVNMAPRQYQRKIKAGSARFEDVYRAVSEYRTKYPDKAVIYSAQKYPELCWAALMAGGSCAAVPVSDGAFLYELSQLSPRPSGTPGVYLLEGSTSTLVYSTAADYTLTLQDGKHTLYQLSESTGELTRLRDVSGAVHLPSQGIWWVRRLK